MHRLSYDWRTRVAHGSLPKRLPEFLRFMKKLDLHTYFRGALHPTGPKFWSFGISDQPIPRRSTFCSDKFYMCIRDEKCKAFTVHTAVALGQRDCTFVKITKWRHKRGAEGGQMVWGPHLSLSLSPRGQDWFHFEIWDYYRTSVQRNGIPLHECIGLGQSLETDSGIISDMKQILDSWWKSLFLRPDIPCSPVP